MPVRTRPQQGRAVERAPEGRHPDLVQPRREEEETRQATPPPGFAVPDNPPDNGLGVGASSARLVAYSMTFARKHSLLGEKTQRAGPAPRTPSANVHPDLVAKPQPVLGEGERYELSLGHPALKLVEAMKAAMAKRAAAPDTTNLGHAARKLRLEAIFSFGAKRAARSRRLTERRRVNICKRARRAWEYKHGDLDTSPLRRSSHSRPVWDDWNVLDEEEWEKARVANDKLPDFPRPPHRLICHDDVARRHLMNERPSYKQLPPATPLPEEEEASQEARGKPQASAAPDMPQTKAYDPAHDAPSNPRPWSNSSASDGPPYREMADALYGGPGRRLVSAFDRLAAVAAAAAPLSPIPAVTASAEHSSVTAIGPNGGPTTRDSEAANTALDMRQNQHQLPLLVRFRTPLIGPAYSESVRQVPVGQQARGDSNGSNGLGMSARRKQPRHTSSDATRACIDQIRAFFKSDPPWGELPWDELPWYESPWDEWPIGATGDIKDEDSGSEEENSSGIKAYVPYHWGREDQENRDRVSEEDQENRDRVSEDEDDKDNDDESDREDANEAGEVYEQKDDDNDSDFEDDDDSGDADDSEDDDE